MRYALTITNPDTYAWGETDTFIIRTDTNPLDMGIKELSRVLINEGYDEDEAKEILGNDSWYIRNCDDIDFDFTLEDEL